MRRYALVLFALPIVAFLCVNEMIRPWVIIVGIASALSAGLLLLVDFYRYGKPRSPLAAGTRELLGLPISCFGFFISCLGIWVVMAGLLALHKVQDIMVPLAGVFLIWVGVRAFVLATRMSPHPNVTLIKTTERSETDASPDENKSQ